MYPGSNRSIAPAVQAQPGASWKSILKLIGQAVGDYAEQTGGELPTMDFDQWTQGWDQSWPQGGYE
jgi:hypothetical protein